MFTINQNLVDDFADKINEKEKKNNKVTSLSSSSTHIQYPSAKAVYDAISEVEASSGGNYIDDYYFDTTTKDIVLDFTSGGSGGGGSGGDVVIDSSWIENSTNPVESQLIKTALDGKSDTSHTHSQYLTEHQSLANYVQKETGKSLFSGSYSDLSNKPSYTATITSSTTGAYKIGSINISGSNVDIYGKDTDTHQSLTNYVQKSSTVGLLKNDGSVMVGGTGSANYAIGNHTHSDYVNPTIADNLTTNDSSQVLSAKQGKVLSDLIGEAITYINK